MRRLLYILLVFTLTMCGMTSWAQGFKENSVLKDGTIYKIGVVKDGVYRITFDEMSAAGIDVNALNLNKISMYGNVSGMLPEANSANTYDDLAEMDIIVDDKGVLFYGQGSCEWTPSGDFFNYQTNYYSDTTFYFLKLDNQNDGRRMEMQSQDTGEPVNEVTSFVDRQYHEVDLHNYYHRGRKWYGETVNRDEGDLTVPFEFKNVITDSRAFLEVNFIGASKVNGTLARVKVNGTQVGSDILIQKSGDYSFGVERTYSIQFNPTDDIIEVGLEIESDNSASYLGLDYFNINAWRSLSYENEQLQFHINRNTHAVVELVGIEKASEASVILDITNPLSPKIQDYTLTGDLASFKLRLVGNTGFVLYEDPDVMSVESMKHIDNQNVHSITNAEMLIITDKIFAQQADEIKAIHEENDGILSEVVFVDEIYNEFSSGSVDITAIRNFVKMVYERSANLKYVLLLGRGTNDYKNVEGYGGNFVPPYEALNSVNEINAYVTDDYYGLLEMEEGDQCLGNMDVAVGRIPVLTPDEAEIVVDKIKRYIYNVKAMGEWRDELLLLSDDTKTYSKNCDDIEAMMDTMSTTVNISKIYADAYVRQKLADGSYCYPDATASIIEMFDDGIMMMTYLGHGGVKGLSASNLFKTKDIESLTNYYKLPFVVTGTCEFSAFDDASFVSAGEILYKMENGGAIGMYTTTRPTQQQLNKTIVTEFMKNTYTNNNIKELTMGDIVRLSKRAFSSNSSNYLSYVFFGDPALRFTYPAQNVVINSINGHTSEDMISVAPMDTLRIEGWVAKGNGALDASFNGVVYPKLFDNKSTYTTLNNSGAGGNYYTFTNYTDVLYDGGISVVNGRFSGVMTVPRSVNNQNGNAKLSFYACDTVNRKDANTIFTNLKVEGNPSVLPDFEGPQINLSWNDGHLTVELHDPQGICHYNSMLGRDLYLSVASDIACKSLVVNDYYEQTTDDYTSGKIEMELELFAGYDNVISLRAWDTHDNSNTASITVNVMGDVVKNTMHNVVNYPNPFSESTSFTVDYNKKNVTVDINIQIFDIMGRVVNTLEYNDLNVLNLKMDWDGRDAAGRRLSAGVYVYKVYLKDSDGCEINTSQRMIVL